MKIPMPEGYSQDESWLSFALMLTDGPWVEFNDDIWNQVSEQSRVRLRAEAKRRSMWVKNDERPSISVLRAKGESDG